MAQKDLTYTLYDLVRPGTWAIHTERDRVCNSARASYSVPKGDPKYIQYSPTAKLVVQCSNANTLLNTAIDSAIKRLFVAGGILGILSIGTIVMLVRR